MRIDAHQHFWALDRGDYGWLTPDLAPLYRDFGPEDLSLPLARNDIDGTVLVQAAPTLAETHYLLSIAEAHSFVRGVVGWVDFEDSGAAQTIADLAKHPKLVGLRPMIQDIDDPDWMLKPELAPAFDAMIGNDLVFDALTLPRHLQNLLRLLRRYPDLRSVIDHGSKPEITSGRFEPWAGDMAELASETRAYVKLSGLVTEAAENWTPDQLRPYVDHLIACFGPPRMIWGSDWPVCTLASTYDHWCLTTENFLADLPEPDRSAVWGQNAIEFYNLDGTA